MTRAGTRRAPRAAGLAPAGDTVLIDGRAAELRLRRSKRARRISLRVDTSSGAVVLTLPPRTARAAGLALIRAHETWLRGRIDALPQPRRFAAGAVVPLDGMPHLIRHEPDARGGAWLDGAGTIVVAGDAAFLPRRLGDFLRAEARRRFGALMRAIAAPAGLAPKRLVIKDTRSRWGSCTAGGTLMFTWRLVMAPPPVQHYVVAHELAHLGRMDHSPAFWALVDRLTPYRRDAERWLQANGPALLRTGAPGLATPVVVDPETDATHSATLEAGARLAER